jgi:hypothetical protein
MPGHVIVAGHGHVCEQSAKRADTISALTNIPRPPVPPDAC